LWLATPDLIVALDERFGEPLDAYVNGSQVWLREDGPGRETLEWRLHPVPGYRCPPGLSTYEVFSAVALALASPPDRPDQVGGSHRPGAATPLSELWEGLEAFPAYGQDVEPVLLASAVTSALGVAPAAFGLVDHTPVGDAWERSGQRTSIVGDLLAQLQSPASQ